MFGNLSNVRTPTRSATFSCGETAITSDMIIIKTGFTASNNVVQETKAATVTACSPNTELKLCSKSVILRCVFRSQTSFFS